MGLNLEPMIQATRPQAKDKSWPMLQVQRKCLENKAEEANETDTETRDL